MGSLPLSPTETKKTIDLRLLFASMMCLAVATFTVAGIASSSRLAAEKSRSELRSVERLVTQLAESKTAGSVTATVEFGHSGEAIANAKRLASITDQQNPLISDLGIRQVPDSEFSIQPTEVKFRGLRMRQIVKFLLSVGQGEHRMAVKNMAITSSRATSAGQELWDVELVLTTTAFSATRRADKP